MQDAWILGFVVILVVTLRVENILLQRKMTLYTNQDIENFNAILRELGIDSFRRFVDDKSLEECHIMLQHLEREEMYEYCAVLRDRLKKDEVNDEDIIF